MRTLEEIIREERKIRKEDGAFGIIACKEEILFTLRMNQKYQIGPQSLFGLLEEYKDRANNDPFFNKRMVLACWELINSVDEEVK